MGGGGSRSIGGGGGGGSAWGSSSGGGSHSSAATAIAPLLAAAPLPPERLPQASLAHLSDGGSKSGDGEAAAMHLPTPAPEAASLPSTPTRRKVPSAALSSPSARRPTPVFPPTAASTVGLASEGVRATAEAAALSDLVPENDRDDDDVGAFNGGEGSVTGTPVQGGRLMLRASGGLSANRGATLSSAKRMQVRSSRRSRGGLQLQPVLCVKHCYPYVVHTALNSDVYAPDGAARTLQSLMNRREREIQKARMRMSALEKRLGLAADGGGNDGL